MKQEPVVEQLLPLSSEAMQQQTPRRRGHAWDYIYEPDAPTVIDELLVRYVEALVYQAVAENMASEQSARMVAMKAATDNAGNVIGELKLVYNKTRQAAITKELSEIVAAPPRLTSPPVYNESRLEQEMAQVKARSFSASAPWWTWSSPRPDAQGVRRPEDGRLGPDAGSAAAAGRRRGAHHRAGLVRRPAPRHDGGQHRRPSPCRSARPRWAASWTCWATRSTSAARSTRRPRSIHRKAPAYDELSPSQAAGNRHQGDRPDLPVRQGRQGGPVRRRRRGQDREHDGAHQQHRQGALGLSVFAGVGERTREGNDFYHEMATPVVVQEDLGESKVAMVYGQMNEPPGNRLRVALTGLTMAESFRDEGRTCCSSSTTSTATRWPVPKCPRCWAACLPPWATSRRWPKKWAAAGAHHLDQGRLDHLDPGRVRACGRPDRPVARHHLRPPGLHRGAVA
jgi:hypothetical protein